MQATILSFILGPLSALSILANVPEDESWANEFYFPESQNFGASVRAMLPRPGGRIYYCGNFYNVAGVANTAGIAQWDGERWSSLGTGVGYGSLHCWF